jgi:hypothetical protein
MQRSRDVPTNVTYRLEAVSAAPGPKIFTIKDLVSAEEANHIVRVRGAQMIDSGEWGGVLAWSDKLNIATSLSLSLSQLCAGKVKRSMTGQADAAFESDTRTSETTWLGREASPVLERLYRRVGPFHTGYLAAPSP